MGNSIPEGKGRTIYVAGPIRGLPEFNYPAFREATRKWRAAGWEVFCPTENFAGATDRTFAEYMRADIAMVARSGAIALLPGWESSRGATLEACVGQTLEVEFYNAETGGQIHLMPLVAAVVSRTYKPVSERGKTMEEGRWQWAQWR